MEKYIPLPRDLRSLVMDYLFLQKGQRVTIHHCEMSWWTQSVVSPAIIVDILPEKDSYKVQYADGRVSYVLISDHTSLTQGSFAIMRVTREPMTTT